jgi:hypothetical protein
MILILLLILLIVFNIKRPKTTNQTIIFTCTTYLSKPNKLNHFLHAIDSIPDKYLIDKFLVINEYDESNTIDYQKIINNKYPYIDFIQKTNINKGQAKSLNIILDQISNYTYWIHWEESWIAKTSFIYKSINIMNKDLTISQLQFTPDWDSDISEDRKIRYNDYFILKSHSLYNKVYNNDNVITWPLYSLRPSINRVSFYLKCDKFDENPKLWPIKFEYEYGIKWLNNNAVKALIQPPIAFRQSNHISTYRV